MNPARADARRLVAALPRAPFEMSWAAEAMPYTEDALVDSYGE